MSLDEYFKGIDNTLNNPFVIEADVKKEKKSSNVGLLVGKAVLTDFSQLHFMEYIELDKKQPVVTYRYHYQSPNKELIFRYDNSPHYRNLKTFPHHKHLKDAVMNSRQKSLSEIIDEIVMLLI